MNEKKYKKARDSFIKTYHKSQTEDEWISFEPLLSNDMEHYTWENNTPIDTLKRLEAMYGKVSREFVGTLIDVINDNRGDDSREILEAGERMVAANLPWEVYQSFDRCKGWQTSSDYVINFSNNITQERVVERLHGLEKMRKTRTQSSEGKLTPHFGIAVIGYIAKDTPEEVLYAADNILKLQPLGKTNPIYQHLIAMGKSGSGAQALKRFLPEGINLYSLTDEGKKLIRHMGLHPFIKNSEIGAAHEVLRAHVNVLQDASYLCGEFPEFNYSDGSAKICNKIRAYLGVPQEESRLQIDTSRRLNG